MKNTSKFLLLVLLLAITYAASAQNTQAGVKGIQDATTAAKGYFDKLVDLMYVVAGILGLVGAIVVFRKWNSGEQDTQKAAVNWFGSMIFMVLVATLLRSFFGLS